MKILKHGDIIVFTCEECGCMFSEIAKLCYSSTGEDGPHYCMSCPDCQKMCWKAVDAVPVEWLRIGI